MTPQEAASKGLAWVPESHPLYGTAGYVGSGGQQPAAAPGGSYMPSQPAGGQQTPASTAGSNFNKPQLYDTSQAAPAGSASDWAGQTGGDWTKNVNPDLMSTLTGREMEQQRGGGETQAQGPGLVPAGTPDYANIYKQAFGSDATQGQLDFFNASTDPTAMIAHIQGMGAQQQKPAATPAATPAVDPADPFQGNGVKLPSGQWVPKNHPLAQQAGATPGTTTPAATPGTTTPGATNPAGPTPKETVTNTYLDQIKRGTNVDTNDPNFRMQADAFSAAQERSRRNAVDDALESSFAQGTRGSGADNVQRRMIDEASARNTGQFEAQLVGRELQSRRDEIQNALKGLSGQISQDEANALQRELAALDAAIKREGIASTAATSAAQLQLQQMLGTGALNVDMLRALLQNSQFSDSFGLQMGQAEFDNYAKLMGL